MFVSNAEPANDVLQVNTLAGNDSVSFFPGVTALLILSVDGGVDTDTIFPTGTAGPDRVQWFWPPPHRPSTWPWTAAPPSLTSSPPM